MQHEVLTHEQIENLAHRLSNLRYDSLCELLTQLSSKICSDAIKDWKRHRFKLSQNLLVLSNDLATASETTEQAWEICKPFML